MSPSTITTALGHKHEFRGYRTCLPSDPLQSEKPWPSKAEHPFFVHLRVAASARRQLSSAQLSFSAQFESTLPAGLDSSEPRRVLVGNGAGTARETQKPPPRTEPDASQGLNPSSLLFPALGTTCRSITSRHGAMNSAFKGSYNKQRLQPGSGFSTGLVSRKHINYYISTRRHGSRRPLTYLYKHSTSTTLSLLLGATSFSLILAWCPNRTKRCERLSSLAEGFWLPLENTTRCGQGLLRLKGAVDTVAFIPLPC
ncbi:hypothetical protein HDV63DRAFT_29313 [Trichoderma sp. SZMC 28014]